MKRSALLTILLLSIHDAAMADSPGHGAAEKSAGLPQFDPSSFASQAFWLLIAFAFLYVFFAKKTLPRVSRTLEERNEQIKSDLSAAEKLKSEAESVQKQYEDTLSSSREEIAKHYQDAEDSVRTMTDMRYQEFQNKAVQKISDIEKSLAEEKARAVDDMALSAAEIASQAVEKIIGVSADVKVAKSVVVALNKTEKKAA